MKVIAFLCVVGALNGCEMPPLSACDMATGEITCDMGWGPDGCWMGDYCMPAGSVCPDPVPFETVDTNGCPMPEPSICDVTTGEILCDMGVDSLGCWVGDYCMPAGSVCPDPIFSDYTMPDETTGCAWPEPSVCDMTTGEIICDMGWGPDGCWMGDYCMPAGSVCPDPIVYEPPMTAAKRFACVLPPPSVCDMETGEITCDMGVDPEGCWMGDYCMPAGSVCPEPIVSEPAMPTGECSLPPPSVCDMTTGEITCDMGVGPDGCWMGDYCMPAGSVCPDPVMP